MAENNADEKAGDDVDLYKGGAFTAAGAKVLYDEWVGTYDDTVKQWGYPGPQRIAESLQGMGYGEKTPVRVLDLGCGTGLVGEALKQIPIGGKGVVGVDISPKSINVLQNDKPGLYSETHFGNLDEKFDFLKAEDFDVVVCAGVMSYIENFASLYSEVIRVSKPGAVFAFTQQPVFWDSDARNTRSEAENLEKEGKWKCENISEPMSYMPGSPDEESKAKQIRIFVYRKI